MEIRGAKQGEKAPVGPFRAVTEAFCGARLQTKTEVRRKLQEDSPPTKTDRIQRYGLFFCFTHAADLNDGLIQKKVDNTDIQYTVIIVPAFTNVVTNDDFRERVTG